MKHDIKVTRSCFTPSIKHWHTRRTPSQYDLRICSSAGTQTYTVRTFDDDLVFLRVENIRPSYKQETIPFDALDVRIREDFIKAVNPSISEDELLTLLYDETTANFINDEKHFIYSFDITAQVFDKIGAFSHVVPKGVNHKKSKTPGLVEERRIFEIDGRWLITISIKEGILFEQACVLDISSVI